MVIKIVEKKIIIGLDGEKYVGNRKVWLSIDVGITAAFEIPKGR